MNGQSKRVNGSRMRVSPLRLVGITILTGGVLSIAWWMATNEPAEIAPPTPAATTLARQLDTSQGKKAATDDIEQSRNDSAAGEEGFDFPFLGKVRSHMRMQEVTTKAKDGSTMATPFRVFTDERGQFRRAEFALEGTAELELAVTRIERAMRARDEKVLGFPSAPAPVSWQTVVATIVHKVPMNEVKRMNVTYVSYQGMDQPPEPLFIVNVFGFDAMPPPSYPMQRDPKWKRTRFICDATGEVILMDDCL